MDRAGGRFVQELYALPAQEFTPARNARAAALKAAGRADEARAVRQMRRPTATLWAANQLSSVRSTNFAARSCGIRAQPVMPCGGSGPTSTSS